VTRVHGRKFKHIAEEGAIRLRVFAVNDDVGSADHRSLIEQSTYFGHRQQG
jgi:hypothetical protein